MMDPDASLVAKAADALRRARFAVVFTGAGVSAESGIPTFRTALTGMWERFDPTALATVEGFRRDPDLVWGWYEWRRAKVARACPNAGHVAIASLQRRMPRFMLVTQNIDDLHERAGSVGTVHLHGSLFEPRCIECSAAAPLPPMIDESVADGCRIAPPRCGACGARLRPGVVWFGENLPEDDLMRAFEAARRCDLLITVGTSGQVFPAAQIPALAAQSGATVIQIDPQPTELDRIAHVNLRAGAGTALPLLIEAAWPGHGVAI